jgi:hypothetical protein
LFSSFVMNAAVQHHIPAIRLDGNAIGVEPRTAL